jgi:hypothetical protein
MSEIGYIQFQQDVHGPSSSFYAMKLERFHLADIFVDVFHFVARADKNTGWVGDKDYKRCEIRVTDWFTQKFNRQPMYVILCCSSHKLS